MGFGEPRLQADPVAAARAELLDYATEKHPFSLDATELKAMLEHRFGPLPLLRGAKARDALTAFTGFLKDLGPEAQRELRPSVVQLGNLLERATAATGRWRFVRR